MVVQPYRVLVYLTGIVCGSPAFVELCSCWELFWAVVGLLKHNPMVSCLSVVSAPTM